MCYKSSFDISITVGEALVPIDSLQQTFFPAHLFLPSKLMQPGGVNGVTQIIELPVRYKCDIVINLVLLAEDFDQLLCNSKVRELILSSNVINTTGDPLMKDNIECTCYILNKEEVTGVGSVSVKGDRMSTQDLVGELGNQLLGELMRTIHIVSSGDDAGKLEGTVVGLDKELSSCLGGGVWVGWL